MKIHAMAKGKLILICQSGGEFITKTDGTLSYEAGEANAININHETKFDDLKLKLAEVSNLDHKTISVKYFLPGNRRNLITLRNDKDLNRMVGFHGNSVTADIFVFGNEGFDHSAMEVHDSRNNTCSAMKLGGTVNHVSLSGTVAAPAVDKLENQEDHISAPSTASAPVFSNLENQASHKNISAGDTNPPPNAGSGAADNKIMDVSNPRQPHTASPASSEQAENDSDYKPCLTISVAAGRSPDAVDTSSPAETVKRRRRSSSWMNGPTNASVTANDEDKRRKKNNEGCNNLTASEILNHQIVSVLGANNVEHPSGTSFSDEGLPEKLVASWRDCISGVGQDFRSVKEFREALQKYAIAHRFVYKLKKNDSNRASGICVEEGCSWSIHASWVQVSETFRIKKFNNVHTCGGESWKNAHPAKKLLVSVIKDKLRDSPHHRPMAIAKSISQDLGLELKYTQVRRGIEDARAQLQGSYKESYNRLPWLLEKLEERNPGSFFKLTIDDEKRLQCLFISLCCCVQSFQNSCRPILFLNSASLKSKYQESLLIATAVDGDDGFFPVAFGIVDSENEDNWNCFLLQLKSLISSALPITFVSEMEMGLNKLLNEMFENSYHGYSMYHLVESFKKNIKGPFHGEGRGVLPGKLLAAAHTVRVSGFKTFMEQIKQVSPNAYDWLSEIEPEHWTTLYFRGEPYNYIVQNVAEPYAKLMYEIRESTITQKVEAMIQMVCDLFNDRRLVSSEWSTTLTPSNETKIQVAAVKAQGLRVFISSDVLFEVHDDCTHVVNIEKCECTCLEWKGNGTPCCHAIAAFNWSGRNGYEFCSKYLTVENYRLTYSRSISPAPEIGAPSQGMDDSDGAKVLPPAPRSTNLQEETRGDDPDKRTVTCSKCKELGHNKASCKASN